MTHFSGTVAPKHINTIRAIIQWGLRLVAMIMVTSGVYMCLQRTLFGLLSGPPFFGQAFQTWQGIGETQPMYRGLALIPVGLVIAFLSTRLAKWMITVPADVCPRCGHMKPQIDSANSTSTRCPECGLEGVIES